jgi:hypothetical protein
MMIANMGYKAVIGATRAMGSFDTPIKYMKAPKKPNNQAVGKPREVKFNLKFQCDQDPQPNQYATKSLINHGALWINIADGKFWEKCPKSPGK